MLVKIVYQGNQHTIETSKAELIKDFRKKVFDATKVKPSCQRLLFQGKFLSDKNQANLCDYRIEEGFKVQLFLIPEPPTDVSKNNNGNASEDANGNSSNKKEASPPPFFEEREPDEEENDVNVSKEEQVKKLREIGADPSLIAEIEKEADETPPDDRCAKCKKNPERKCRECNCRECGVNENDDQALFCEECEYLTHGYCLDPPISKEEIADLPDEWYCPLCKRDPNEIVAKGEAVRLGKRANMPSNAKPQNRDWGRGKATAGVKKKCVIVGDHYFGPIPGIEVGMSWQYRVQVCSTGVHRPPVAGISGQSKIGCQSIVLAGGYEDDEDHGDWFYYTGAGGRDLSGNKRTNGQSLGQTLDKTNLAMSGKNVTLKN